MNNDIVSFHEQTSLLYEEERKKWNKALQKLSAKENEQIGNFISRVCVHNIQYTHTHIYICIYTRHKQFVC